MKLKQKVIGLMQKVLELTQEGELVWDRMRGGTMVVELDGIGSLRVPEYIPQLEEGQSFLPTFSICDERGQEAVVVNPADLEDSTLLSDLSRHATGNSQRVHSLVDSLSEAITKKYLKGSTEKKQ